MTKCLDEANLLSFGQGTMPAAERPAYEAHVAECDECRALVSAVRRSSMVDPEEAAPAVVEEPRPRIEVGAVRAPVAVPEVVTPAVGPAPRSWRTMGVLLAAGVALLVAVAWFAR